MKMYRNDWWIRLTTVVVIAAGLIAFKLFAPVVGLDGFWPWMLAVMVGIGLGQLVRRLLICLSSGAATDHPPSD